MCLGQMCFPLNEEAQFLQMATEDLIARLSLRANIKPFEIQCISCETRVFSVKLGVYVRLCFASALLCLNTFLESTPTALRKSLKYCMLDSRVTATKYTQMPVSTSKPEQNGRHCADDSFKCIFFQSKSL